MIHYVPIKKIEDDFVDRYFRIETRPSTWINSEYPVIIPLSIYSSFHEGTLGFSKIKTLIYLVKKNTKNKVTILLCDSAHVNAHSIRYKRDIEHTAKKCKLDAEQYYKRFEEILINCEVFYWSDFVNKDKNYYRVKKDTLHLFQKDNAFQEAMEADIKILINKKHGSNDFEYVKELIMRDLLEHCIFLKIAWINNYRFEFYPGKRYLTANYINGTLMKSQMNRINVGFSEPMILCPRKKSKNSNKITQKIVEIN